MFIMNQKNGDDILAERKRSTLRPIRANGKGYFKEGNIYWVHIGRDFTQPHLCRVQVNKVSFVDIEDLGAKDWEALGYESKAEYMGEPFNKNNPSTERVRYDFKLIKEVL